MQNFVTISSGVSAPRIRDFTVLLGCDYSYFFVFWFSDDATAYTPLNGFLRKKYIRNDSG